MRFQKEKFSIDIAHKMNYNKVELERPYVVYI